MVQVREEAGWRVSDVKEEGRGRGEGEGREGRE